MESIKNIGFNTGVSVSGNSETAGSMLADAIINSAKVYAKIKNNQNQEDRLNKSLAEKKRSNALKIKASVIKNSHKADIDNIINNKDITKEQKFAQLEILKKSLADKRVYTYNGEDYSLNDDDINSKEVIDTMTALDTSYTEAMDKYGIPLEKRIENNEISKVNTASIAIKRFMASKDFSMMTAEEKIKYLTKQTDTMFKDSMTSKGGINAKNTFLSNQYNFIKNLRVKDNENKSYVLQDSLSANMTPEVFDAVNNQITELGHFRRVDNIKIMSDKLIYEANNNPNFVSVSQFTEIYPMVDVIKNPELRAKMMSAISDNAYRNDLNLSASTFALDPTATREDLDKEVNSLKSDWTNTKYGTKYKKGDLIKFIELNLDKNYMDENQRETAIQSANNLGLRIKSLDNKTSRLVDGTITDPAVLKSTIEEMSKARSLGYLVDTKNEDVVNSLSLMVDYFGGSDDETMLNKYNEIVTRKAKSKPNSKMTQDVVTDTMSTYQSFDTTDAIKEEIGFKADKIYSMLSSSPNNSELYKSIVSKVIDDISKSSAGGVPYLGEYLPHVDTYIKNLEDRKNLSNVSIKYASNIAGNPRFVLNYTTPKGEKVSKLVSGNELRKEEQAISDKIKLQKRIDEGIIDYNTQKSREQVQHFKNYINDSFSDISDGAGKIIDGWFSKDKPNKNQSNKKIKMLQKESEAVKKMKEEVNSRNTRLNKSVIDFKSIDNNIDLSKEFRDIYGYTPKNIDENEIGFMKDIQTMMSKVKRNEDLKYSLNADLYDSSSDIELMYSTLVMNGNIKSVQDERVSAKAMAIIKYYDKLDKKYFSKYKYESSDDLDIMLDMKNKYGK